MLSPEGEIRRDEGCIDYAGQFVMIYPCHGMKGNQEWIYGVVCSISVYRMGQKNVALYFCPYLCQILTNF